MTLVLQRPGNCTTFLEVGGELAERTERLWPHVWIESTDSTLRTRGREGLMLELID